MSHKQKECFKKGTQASRRICSRAKIPTKRQTSYGSVSLHHSAVIPGLPKSIISTDGNLDNKVKACWLHQTALTLLPISSLLFPGLLLLSLMEGERSRFLIRLVIVDPSTDIISRCTEVFTPHTDCAWGTSPGLRQKHWWAQLCSHTFTYLSAILLGNSTPVTLQSYSQRLADFPSADSRGSNQQQSKLKDVPWVNTTFTINSTSASFLARNINANSN